MSGITADNLERSSGLIKAASVGPSSGSSNPTATTNPSAAGDRFINTTSGEVFVCIDATEDANKWRGQLGTEIDPPTAEQGGRGLWAGDTPPSNVIDYVTIATTGNATDFGDLITARGETAATSNGSRAIWAGGYADGPTYFSEIEYITIATTGDATDFGDISSDRNQITGCSDGTKGVFWGGSLLPLTTLSNIIEYVNIASTGNVTDFGDLTAATRYMGATSNGPRGVSGGGRTDAGVDVIEYITIASTGNAADFGDLVAATYMYTGAVSDLTKGIWPGGHSGGAYSDKMDVINIASTGNATDFGNLTDGRAFPGGCCNGTRACFGGGYDPAVGDGTFNIIDHVTVASLGNASDFGDLTTSRMKSASTAGD